VVCIEAANICHNLGGVYMYLLKKFLNNDPIITGKKFRVIDLQLQGLYFYFNKILEFF